MGVLREGTGFGSSRWLKTGDTWFSTIRIECSSTSERMRTQAWQWLRHLLIVSSLETLVGKEPVYFRNYELTGPVHAQQNFVWNGRQSLQGVRHKAPAFRPA